MNNSRSISVLIIFAMLCAVGFVSEVSAEEITIVGTGSGVAILRAVGEAFSQSHPEVAINLHKSIGSTGAIKPVGREKHILGRVAREIKEQEQHYELTYTPYAKNPIVFFVNNNVGIQNLSIQQILDIYSGKITNWQAVGGSDTRIRVIRREEGDSSLGVLLKSFPGFKDITVTSKSKITLSDPKTIAAVEKVSSSIAYGTHANAKDAQVDILQISDKSVADPDYAYVGILAFVYKKQYATGNIKKFVEFATSEAAHEAIIEAGGSPLP